MPTNHFVHFYQYQMVCIWRTIDANKGWQDNSSNTNNNRNGSRMECFWFICNTVKGGGGGGRKTFTFVGELQQLEGKQPKFPLKFTRRFRPFFFCRPVFRVWEHSIDQQSDYCYWPNRL